MKKTFNTSAMQSLIITGIILRPNGLLWRNTIATVIHVRRAITPVIIIIIIIIIIEGTGKSEKPGFPRHVKGSGIPGIITDILDGAQADG